MACRKIPAQQSDASGGVSRQALSLVTFFGQAKKVTRRKAEAFDSASSARQQEQLFPTSHRPLPPSHEPF
jgi:hypothetical protein